MIRNLPSQALPKGAVIEAGNFNVTTNGLKTRGGFAPLITPIETLSTNINDQFDYLTGDVQNTFIFQQNSGQSELLTITNKALYKVLENGYQRINFQGTLEADSVAIYDTDKIEVTQLIGIDPPEVAAYTTIETGITDILRVDDYIRYGDELGLIYEITDDGTYYRIRIKVDNPLLWDGYSGQLNTELNFLTGSQYKVDSALVNGIDTNKIVFTVNRGLALGQYDYVGNLTLVPIDSTSTVGSQFDIDITDARVATWYRNRLWIANTIEDGGVYRQRVRWSDASTYLNLNTADRFRPENYVDLSDSMGEILAIYPMGELLFVYCSDAIYYGRASNINNLPYTFVKINTPGIGLVGQSAITPWIDGHYFVGQDEIYFMDAASSIRPIGSTVLGITLDKCFNKAGIDVRPDPANDRIVFLFPEDLGESDINERNCASKLYTFNYKTQAWSFLEASYTDTPTGNDYNYYFSSISSSMLYSGESNWNTFIDLDPVGIDNPATYNWDTWKINYSTWDSLKDGQLTDHTFLFGLLFRDQTELLTTDFYIELSDAKDDILGFEQTSSPVRKSFISADYDFDIPDDNKQINRFTVKLEEHVLDNTLFNVYVSNDRGRTYKPVDQLMILAGDDEGKVNFRSKGSTFRFKIESDTLDINTINEFVIRLSKRGKEI
jgi:hypothetical protein